MKKIIAFLGVFLLLMSCDGNDNKKKEKKSTTVIKPSSTGRINHLLVVVEPNVWQGRAGKTLQKVLKSTIKGLPQPEEQFAVSTVPSKAFSPMFENSRNILVLQLSDKKVFSYSKDTYAKPQTILQVKAPTEQELLELVAEKAAAIIKVFKDADIANVQKQHKRKLLKTKLKALDGLRAKMNILNQYRVVMDTMDSFFWLRKHISGGIASGDQTNNIIAYEVPMFDTEKPVLEQIIQNRDVIGKRFIRGDDAEKMYMITEAARKPSVELVKINGHTAYETRGTWEVFGAFNAGPFLNYSIIDRKNNRVLVVEGFNYAPSVNKRDFMFELEAMLKTTRILP